MEEALARPEAQIVETASTYRGAAQTDQVRQATVREIVKMHKALLSQNSGKVDLADTQKVKDVANAYMESCENAGIIPSITGFAAMLGVTRAWVYKFLAEHPSSATAQLIERLRTAWTAIRISCAERGGTSETITIFLLKNSNMGFADRLEIEPVQPVSPLDGLNADEARRRITEAFPDEE